MYNDNDEMFEVSDFDDDIHRREALIEEARSIPVSSDWNEVMHQVSDLRRRWRRIQFWDSAYEKRWLRNLTASSISFTQSAASCIRIHRT